DREERREGLQVLQARRPLHHQHDQARVERMDEGEPTLLPSAEGDRGQDREVAWPLTLPLFGAPSARPRGASAAGPWHVAGRGARAPRRRFGGGAVALGVAMGYLSIVVLLPLAALVWASRAGGLDEFWS